jgi:acyl carrier protein
MTDKIEGEIIQIIREATRTPDADMETNTPLEDLGVDSLDFVEMLFIVEERFGIDVPFNANYPRAVFTFRPGGDAADAVRSLVGRKALAA